jgi:hypothetical protein
MTEKSLGEAYLYSLYETFPVMKQSEYLSIFSITTNTKIHENSRILLQADQFRP